MKGALICAILPIAAGCSVFYGEGNPGYGEFKHGEYAQAKADFTDDINNRPNSPIAQFNMGDSYRQEGDNGKADGMFHQVAADGKTFAPDRILEVGGTNHDNITANAVACRHLHEDRQLDANCGDQMVAVVEPVAEAPPAVEAEATAPPPAVYQRKQDRN